MSDENVLQFRARPPETPADHPGVLQCPDCGSEWFGLGSFSEDDFWIPGVVALNLDGSVDGYSGTPHCSECGREVLP